MTLRIPKALLIVLGVMVLAGAGVAVYFMLIKSDEVCYLDNGDEVDCGEEGALSQAEYEEQQAAEAEAEATEAEAQRKAEKCEGQIGSLSTELEELDSRLDVGLTYDEYNTHVGDIRVEYDQVSIKSLDVGCLSDVAVHLEDAMNSYVKADGVWNDCLVDFDCRTDSIDPQLQGHWADAASDISDAERSLTSLAEP
jgi:hypothetical protein